MRSALVALLFILVPALNAAVPQQGTEPNQLSDRFLRMITADWDAWSVTRHYQRTPPDLSFLRDILHPDVLDVAVEVIQTEVVAQERGDPEGGYDLGIIELRFPTATAASEVVAANPGRRANLKGSPLFTGYEVRRCGAVVTILHSRAAATDPLRQFFQEARHLPCD